MSPLLGCDLAGLRILRTVLFWFTCSTTRVTCAVTCIIQPEKNTNNPTNKVGFSGPAPYNFVRSKPLTSREICATMIAIKKERRYKMLINKMENIEKSNPIVEIVVKVMSTPANFKRDALKEAGFEFEDIAYFSSECIEPRDLKVYFTEPREYTVTLGVKTNLARKEMLLSGGI
jgi:hypothetical protein